MSSTSESASKTSNRSLGLPDDAFAQKRPNKGLITKSEVRAVSLYHLGLRRNSVIWDVGAGTGSVAIEVAHIAHEGKTYAIERDSESLEHLKQNVDEFGQGNIEIVSGEAPESLDDLPDPDSVFIGGSGCRFLEILDYCQSRLNQPGRIVVNLATMERAIEALHYLRSLDMQTELLTVSISRGKEMPDGATRLEALNPVFVVVSIKGD